MFISNIVQIIISLLLVLILAFIGYAIYNNESISSLKNFNNIRKEIDIFKGIVDFKNTRGSYYNTKDKTSASYVDLSPSINQNGGAEYTYNFWLYKDGNQLKNVLVDDIALILRGSKTKLHYNSPSNCFLNTDKQTYVFVKNPLIRMKSDGSSIIVEYNTVTFPDAFHDGGNAEINANCSGSWFDKNKGLLGIYDLSSQFDKNWFMVTVILQETSPDNDILNKNRTSCKMYINSVLMLDRLVESPYNITATSSAAMRHNKGPLYINPGGIFKRSSGGLDTDDSVTTEKTLMMADLKYYNFALSSDEISILYKAGFTHGSAPTPSKLDDDQSLYTMSSMVKEGPKAF